MDFLSREKPEKLHPLVYKMNTKLILKINLKTITKIPNKFENYFIIWGFLIKFSRIQLYLHRRQVKNLKSYNIKEN